MGIPIKRQMEFNKSNLFKSASIFLATVLIGSNINLVAMATSSNSSQIKNTAFENKHFFVKGDEESEDENEENQIELFIGQTYQLPTGCTCNIEPSGFLDYDEERNTLTAKKAGKTQATIDESPFVIIIRYKIELTEDKVETNLSTNHQMQFEKTDNEYLNLFVWESADESIATVDNNGLIMPRGKGTTKITVSLFKGTEYESVKTIPITVQEDEYFYFLKDTSDIEFKGVKTLNYNTDIDEELISFSTEDTEVIGINGKIVTSIAPGEATVKAIYKEGTEEEKVIGTCKVKTIGSIELNDSKINTEKNPIYKDETCYMIYANYNDRLSFSAKITPDNFSEEEYRRYVTWESSDTNSATVDEMGNISIVGFNDAVIKVTLFKDTVSEVSKEIELSVNFEAEVTPSFESLQIGDEIQVSVYTSSDYLNNSEYTWMSTNPEIATVDDEGNVKAISEGYAIIYPSSELFTKARNSLSYTDEEGNIVEEDLPPISMMIEVEGTTIKSNSFSMYKGKTKDLSDNEILDRAIASFEQNNNVTVSKEKSNSEDPVSSDPASSEPDVSSTPVVQELSITTHPENVTTNSGKTASFSVTAIGEDPIEYQWYYRKTGDSSWSKWSGMTSQILSFVVDNTMDGMGVFCKVTDNTGANLNSRSATLTVNSTDTEVVSGNNETTVFLEWEISNNSIGDVDGQILTAKDYGILEIKPYVTLNSQRVYLADESGASLKFTVTVQSKFIFEENKNIKVGETEKISCKGIDIETIVSPENATWSSSDETVATVDSEGNVTAVGSGSCFIYFTSKELDRANKAINGDNAENQIYTCIIFADYDFTIDEETTQDIELFQHKKINYTLDPYSIHDRIEWTSSNEKVIEVDNEGNVYSVGLGTATVTIKLLDSTYKIKFNVSYDSSTPNASETKKIEIDKTDKIDLTQYIPEGIEADASTFRWFSTDDNVVTVDAEGNVTAVGIGNAEIVAGVVSGTITANFYSCKYEVYCDLKLKESQEIEVFQSIYAKDIISYISREDLIPTLNWSIEDESIATIDGMGIITANKVGKTKIHAKMADKTYECEISVTGGIEFIDDTINVLCNSTLPVDSLLSNVSSNALRSSLTFESANTDIVEISGDNLISKSIGSTKVIVSSPYLNKNYEVNIIVTYEFSVLDNVNLLVGDSLELTSTMDPVDLEVNWTSSNPDIVSVDEKGKITALNIGSAQITAKVVNGSSYTSNINITLPLSLEVTENVIVKDKIPVKLIVPEGMKVSDFDSVEWVSSDESIATIDQSGMATGISAGTTQISAKVKYKNFEQTYTANLTVGNITLQSISIKSTKDTIDLSSSDRTATLSLELNPSDATGLSDITWKSLNESVGIIDKNGKFIATGTGSTIIQAELNGKTADYVITVTKSIKSVEIKFDYEQITVGNEYQADLIINPEGATDNVEIEWITSDPDIITVDENGLVKAIKKGTAKLTAKIKGFEAEYEITVGGADIVTEPETPDKSETPDVIEKPSVSNSDVSNSDIDKPKAEDKDKDTASEDTTSSDNENQKPVSDSDKESRGNTDEDTSSNDTPSDNTTSKSEKDNTSKDNEKPNTTVNTGESNTMSIIAYVTMILAGVSATIMTFFRRRLKREPQA